MSWVANNSGNTRTLPVRPDDDEWRPRRPGSGFVGVPAAIVVLLGLLVLGAKVFATLRGLPGPPASEVTLHAGGAVVALLLYLAARRAAAAARVLATAAVLAMACGLLWFYWYS